MLHFLTGAIDVAFMGSSPLMLAYLYRLPVKILAVANQHYDSLVVMRSSHAIRDGSSEDDVIKIGTVIGSDGHVLARYFVESQLPGRKVMVVNLSPAECLDALRIGMIDYASLWEPHVCVAKQQGGEKVFSDRQIDHPMCSFIVATDKAVMHSGCAIKRFLAAHDDAIRTIDSLSDNDFDRMRMVFGTELTVGEYRHLLANNYKWPLSTDDLAGEISACIEGVLEMQRSIQMLAPRKLSIDDLLPQYGGSDAEQVTIGYSNSIMCAGFHVADIKGMYGRHGFAIQRSGRRVEERIALLRESLQHDLRLCYELIGRDPELVVQKVGRLNEQCFREIETKVLGEESKSAAQVIDNIRQRRIVANEILTWADSVRAIRNVATHGHGSITSEEATTAFNIFVNIAEWYDANIDDILSMQYCSRCHEKVEADWVACPGCGMRVLRKCKECNEQLDLSWKACPYCGARD